MVTFNSNIKYVLGILIPIILTGCGSTNINSFLLSSSAELSDDLIDEADEDTSGDQSDEDSDESEDSESDSGILLTLSVDSSSLTEDNDSTTVTVTLSEAIDVDCTVTLALSGDATLDTDYSIDDTVLVITAGETSTTTELSLILDELNEGNESIIIDIDSFECDDDTVVESGTQQETVTIIDNDTPTVTLSGDASIAETGVATTITATLDKDATSEITINLSSSGASASDYSLSETTITILLGNDSGSITFTSVDDTIYEGDETVIVSISSASGDNVSIGDPLSASVIIQDDEDEPVISLGLSNEDPVSEGNTKTITATTATAADSNIIVYLDETLTTASSSDYSLASSITIPAGSLSASTTFTASNDSIYESDTDESLSTAISGVSLGSYDATSYSIDIIDTDSPPSISLSVGDSSIDEGTSTPITASLSGSVSFEAIAISLSSSGSASSSDFSLSSSIITVPAGSSSASVTFYATDDSASANDATTETATFSGAVSNGATTSGTINNATISIRDLDQDGVW
jgi:hypothetical protein